MAFLIDEFPSTLTIPELSLALGVGPDDFSGSDALERAIRELVGAGLLHHQGSFLVPTRTALYFASLEMA